MNRLCAALLGLLLASAAQAQSVSWPPPAGTVAFLCVYNTSPPTLSTTNVGFAQCDSSGKLLVTSTFTPSGIQNVNLTQILSAAPSLTNPLWVFPATGATFPVSGTFFQATQPTASVGSAIIATGQASVTTGNISIVAARTGVVGTGRKSVCVVNVTGTGPVYIGVTGVSTANGQYLAGVAGASICLDTQAAIFGTVPTITQTVSYSETF